MGQKERILALDYLRRFVIQYVIRREAAIVPKGYRILESAYKHGITEQEINYVLSDKNPTRRFYEMHDDKHGNAQDMAVAYTGTRSWPIEIGLCYRQNENVVFHARKVSNNYKKQYEIEP